MKDKHGTKEKVNMRKVCININGNNSNFLASHRLSFAYIKILSTTDPGRGNQYLNAFATNMDLSISAYQTQAIVILM